MKSNQEAMRAYFEALPVYTPAFKSTVDSVVAALGESVKTKKGQVVEELTLHNKDFWFLKSGFLKEMYKNPIEKEDSLFSLIPPLSIFVNEDTLFNDQHPQHYYTTYSDVEFIRFKYEDFERINAKHPLLQLLYLSGTAEIQKNRRARLIMLRMRRTIDRVEWVKTNRPDLYKHMDRVTLAQYIGVSRAGLYRAFEKSNKFQF